MKFIVNPLSGQPTPVLNNASEIKYDPTSSGLGSGDVQAAIDELQDEIVALPDPITYKGTWNAATNTPTLSNSDTDLAGYLYQVNVAGTQNFGAGAISFEIGDKVVNDGSAWQKWDMTDAVTSVNGATGAVTVNAINQLTGDVTAGPASGSASAAATLATVNSNVGSFGSASQVATITLDAKGRATAASNTAIQITESQVTNLTIDLSNKQNKALGDTHIWVGNVSNVAADVAMSGAISIDHNGVTSYAGTVPVNKGGTNSTATLNNNRIMQSSGSAIVEAAAITANRALISDSNGIPTHATTTATEIGYVNGVTSAIQSQLDLKAPLASPALTGTPTAPTAAANTNSTAIATTAYVDTATAVQAANNARNLNWINNYGIEVATTGYATYADAAAATPVDGTGGSPTVTIARNTSSPLDGTADLSFVKDAANRQGEGFSYDFTIDSAYQGTIQQFAFNYKIASGTYASGDMTLWIYDVTNAVLVSQPSGNSIISTSIPTQQGQCTFQTSINSTSYRAIWHVTTTSASAYTLRFDNISVGPQINASGGVDTAWAQYVPTFTGFGTVTTSNLWWRREGPDVVVRGTFISGTTTGTEARMTLPSITSLSTLPTLSNCGVFIRSVTTTSHGGAILIEPSLGYVTFGPASTFNSTSSNAGSKGLGTDILGNTETCFVEFRVPIQGWGSNTVLSTSANTRLVAFSATTSSTAAATTTPFVFTNVLQDTVAGYNVSNGRYTVQVPGVYCVQAGVWSNATNFTPSIYKNGTILVNGTISNSSAISGNVTFTFSCVVGDIIDIRPLSGTPTANGGAATNYFSLYLVQGPQQIAASERISFNATTSSTAASTTQPFIYTVKATDSHNAYSTSTGQFTAPAPGFYQFNAAITVSSGNDLIRLYKNGTQLAVGSPFTTTSVGVIGIGILLTTNDVIDIRTNSAATGSGAAATNYFSGFRVGGV